MLELNKTDATDNIVVTLETATKPYFNFVFTHVASKKVVQFVKADSDDLSGYKYRYSEFAVAVEDLFGDMPAGEWHYIIYEQADETPVTDYPLEWGKMQLLEEKNTIFTKYDGVPITYQSYGS